MITAIFSLRIQYTTKKRKSKTKIKDNRNSQKKINISSVTVIPQGGGAFYSNILSNNNTNDLNSYFINLLLIILLYFYKYNYVGEAYERKKIHK